MRKKKAKKKGGADMEWEIKKAILEYLTSFKNSNEKINYLENLQVWCSERIQEYRKYEKALEKAKPLEKI